MIPIGQKRRYLAFLVSVFSLSGCSDPTGLAKGGLCEGSAIGECFPGYVVTSSAGSECLGRVEPRAEVCGDRLDNDCDGRTDERCDEDGDGYNIPEDCHDRNRTIHPGAPERCNGLDDDCNGLIDDAPIDAGGLCFGAEFWRATHEPCRAGVLHCLSGWLECQGEVLPTDERCGDRVDNDCNGAIDDVSRTSTEAVSLDVVLLVDRSGSMHQTMPLIRSTLHAFVDKLDTTPELDGAVWFIDVPPAGGSVPAPSVTCYGRDAAWPIDPCENPREAIDELRPNHGGLELSYDALFGVGAHNWIRWRDGALRVVVFFGDEEGQTLQNLSQKVVAEALADEGIRAHLFVAYFSEYGTIAADTNGGLHSLDASIPVAFETATDPGCH